MGTCSQCGKNRLIVKRVTMRFNVGYDWEDSITQTTCLKCYLKSAVYSVIHPGVVYFKTIRCATSFALQLKAPLRERVRLFNTLMKNT